MRVALRDARVIVQPLFVCTFIPSMLDKHPLLSTKLIWAPEQAATRLISQPEQR